MSGIATQTRAMVDQISSVKSKTILLDTRKTAPGLRILGITKRNFCIVTNAKSRRTKKKINIKDKLAVSHGGGHNHRMGLYDMIMIKDNHITASGGIEKAIDNCLNYIQNNEKLKHESIPIEIECATLEQVERVCSYAKGKVQRIMLDNMVKRTEKKGVVDTTMLEKALQIISGRFETEASGNITLESVAQVAKTNVDFVSTGSVTHSVQALDISLKFSE
ncbi:nicotinate-nucleotide diphosphorylase [Reticulomyxa filosa]|uniref:Nicotinate-nucleotide diphosphorylase n=1 Tax=Reticulomyxa filosa TaxID=46433 RepID=X6PDI9_RETFI|nr:nicotinate-nucleotide diphosphorylase [Reticulomyxa filosa]|eukprot:ETO36271.1 nicotinate-nucleotide diphosphorylase [Reticulomyxa filosa]